MSPSQFHATKDNNNNMPPPLKINKNSHFIKKSSSFSSLSPPSSSSSSSSSLSVISTSMTSGAVALNKPPQRHPVIIYTHSPKVIHTQPRDFMALVQKLTGLSRSDEDCDDHNLSPPKHPKEEPVSNNIASMVASKDNGRKNMIVVGTEDNETSSVITEENNCTNSISENQVNSCFVSPPILEPPVNPYLANLPVFPPPNSSEFMCSSQPLLNYPNSLYFNHSMRSSLEGVNEFREY